MIFPSMQLILQNLADADILTLLDKLLPPFSVNTEKLNRGCGDHAWQESQQLNSCLVAELLCSVLELICSYQCYHIDYPLLSDIGANCGLLILSSCINQFFQILHIISLI